jgi:hypothetical protein
MEYEMAQHMACIGNKRDAYRVLVGKSEGKRSLEDLGIYFMTILKWILRKQNTRT